MKIAINGKVIDMEVEETALEIPAQDYGELVESLIRRKYSLSAELAILRQRDSKPAEFAEYNAYAEQCKAEAKRMIKED